MTQHIEFPSPGHKYQLLMKHIVEYAARMRSDSEIVYKDIFRYTYAGLYERAQRLSHALQDLGV